MSPLTIGSRLVRILAASPAILVVPLLAYFAISNPRILSVGSLQSMFQMWSIIALVAVGIACTMIVGEFDLSVAAIVPFSGIVAVQFGENPWVGAVAAVAVGVVIGAFNGLVVAKLRVASLMATVGTMLFVVGLGFVITGSRPVFFDDVAVSLAIDAPIAGVFSVRSLITVAAVVLLAALLRFTRPGVEMYAAGGGRRAAEVLGVHVDRGIVTAFVISGGTAALAGTLLAFSLASATPMLDLDVLLQGATAAIAGGVLLTGGVGSPLHAAFGAVFITVLNSGLSISGMSSALIQLANGLALVVVMIFAYMSARRARTGGAALGQGADSTSAQVPVSG